MTSGKTVSVVIQTYNRKDLLEKNLRALAAQTLPAGMFEVIIVDDGSADGTGDFVRGFQAPYRIEYIYQENGADIPRNVGGRAAKNDFIQFYDDDVIPQPGALEATLRAHNRFDGPTAVIGSIQWAPEKKLTLFLRYAGKSGSMTGSNLIKNPDDVPFQFALGGNFSVPRDIFMQSGGFDTDLKYYGYKDIEFGYRLKKAHGVRLVYAEDAVGDHWCCPEFEKFCERRELVGAHAVILYAKHPELSGFLKMDRIKRRGLFATIERAALAAANRFFRLIIPALEAMPVLAPLRNFAYRLCIFYHYQKGVADYLKKIEGKKVPPYPAP